ncbi:prepilin peptidase [Angustibacter luteus]|uniref:Prepilin leader peptidase/N-methyltransferase n=1 Tax=Angustibacter luteus TaxID=658456 RepID=A0ABW1J9A3_9ACTN
MTAFVVIVSAAFGLAIGSFLNVVIWRVPRGESVVSPPSHCPRCDHPIRQRDNIPVLSWLLLRGRCRDCSNPISPRYPLVELATAVLFAVVALRFGADWQLPAYLYLAAITVALTMIDIDVRRLPDAIVLPSYAVALVLLLLPAVLDNRWDDLLRAVLGGAALFAGYFLLIFIKPGAMGFGDVKLAGVLGIYLGWLSWGVLLLGAFAGFLLGGVYGIVLMLAGRAGRKSKIPYGPFMLAGAMVAVLVGERLVEAYRGMIGI